MCWELWPLLLQEEVSAEEVEEDDATWAKNVTAGKLSKGEKLMAVDHSTIDYPPFRRNFYIEVSTSASHRLTMSRSKHSTT